MKRPRTLGQQAPADRRRRLDAERRQAKPWRSWYGLAAWKARRRRQLDLQPLCERCKANGRAVIATVANHVVPHRGDWHLFIRGKLESCCKPCHDSVVQAEERAEARAAIRRGGGRKSGATGP